MYDRKCALCDGLSVYIKKADDIRNYATSDSTFISCTYSDTWEICKQPKKRLSKQVLNQLTPLLNPAGDLVGVLQELY